MDGFNPFQAGPRSQASFYNGYNCQWSANRSCGNGSCQRLDDCCCQGGCCPGGNCCPGGQCQRNGINSNRQQSSSYNGRWH